MVLTDESHDELDKLIEEQDLWADNFCLECLFYMHHDINNPEQESYDDNFIFKVEEYQNGTEMRILRFNELLQSTHGITEMGNPRHHPWYQTQHTHQQSEVPSSYTQSAQPKRTLQMTKKQALQFLLNFARKSLEDEKKKMNKINWLFTTDTHRNNVHNLSQAIKIIEKDIEKETEECSGQKMSF